MKYFVWILQIIMEHIVFTLGIAAWGTTKILLAIFGSILVLAYFFWLHKQDDDDRKPTFDESVKILFIGVTCFFIASFPARVAFTVVGWTAIPLMPRITWWTVALLLGLKLYGRIRFKDDNYRLGKRFVMKGAVALGAGVFVTFLCLIVTKLLDETTGNADFIHGFTAISVSIIGLVVTPVAAIMAPLALKNYTNRKAVALDKQEQDAMKRPREEELKRRQEQEARAHTARTPTEDLLDGSLELDSNNLMARSDQYRLNPFTSLLSEAEAVAESLTAQKKAVDEELQWFQETNRYGLANRLLESNNHLDSINQETLSKKTELEALQSKLDKVSASIGTLYNPLNWFVWEQREYRRCRQTILDNQREIELATAQLSTAMKEAENEIRSTSAIIARYDSFDQDARQRVAADLDQKLVSARAKCDRLQSREKGLNQALEPVVIQIRDFEKRIKQAMKIRNRAQELDDELSCANNSYERAMIHDACEREFDTGSPRKIIGQKTREISRLERDFEKAKKRAYEIAERASRIVNSIVIDGNNLCYDNNGLIGVSALTTIVPLLHSEYSLIVVFDASIRKILRSNDVDIRHRFPDRTQVHIVATSRKADETVLDLAEHEKTTYVLSNDRFGEFNDKQAVRDNRVIRHEIIGGRILIHDLGIDAIYNTND